MSFSGIVFIGLCGESGFHELLERFDPNVDLIIILFYISTWKLRPFLLPNNLIWTLNITIPLGILMLVVIPRCYILLYL